jgi:hypothetical protein
MVAPTWITPGCVQSLENKERFHTAWVKTGQTEIEQELSALLPQTDIARRLRHSPFNPIAALR